MREGLDPEALEAVCLAAGRAMRWGGAREVVDAALVALVPFVEREVELMSYEVWDGDVSSADELCARLRGLAGG